MWPCSAVTRSVFHVLMLSSRCPLELVGSTQESTALPSGLQWSRRVFPFSIVDQHVSLPLAPSDRLRLCPAATLRRWLCCNFTCWPLGGLLLFGRGRPLTNEVFSANFHHVMLPRFHFVFVAHLVVFGQLCVDLTCGRQMKMGLRVQAVKWVKTFNVRGL